MTIVTRGPGELFGRPRYGYRNNELGEQDPRLTFLSGDIEEAIETAKKAAGGKNVVLFGASIPKQCMLRGLLDEIVIHLVPVLLGGGIQLFTGAEGDSVAQKRVELSSSGQITNLRFSVSRSV